MKPVQTIARAARDRRSKTIASAAVMVLFVAACGSSEDNPATTAAQVPPTTSAPSTTSTTAVPATTQPPATTTAPSPESVVALSAADSYIEALSAGDVEAMILLFAPDGTIDWFDPRTQTEFKMITAFFAGQGTIYTPPDCAVNHEVPGESVFVFCEFGTHTAASQAVDAPLVPTRFTIVVTPDGISRLTYTYEEDMDFHPIEDPFGQWIRQNHPDSIEFGAWTSIEEARQQGELAAEYALEWAAYLENNGCTVVLDGALVPSIAC